MFFLIAVLLLVLTFSPAYKILRRKGIFFLFLFLAVLSAVYFIFYQEKNKLLTDVRQAGFLLAPLIWILLFKFFDFIQLLIASRHFIIPNKYMMTEVEGKYWNAIDLIGFFSLLLIPILGGISISSFFLK